MLRFPTWQLYMTTVSDSRKSSSLWWQLFIPCGDVNLLNQQAEEAAYGLSQKFNVVGKRKLVIIIRRPPSPPPCTPSNMVTKLYVCHILRVLIPFATHFLLLTMSNVWDDPLLYIHSVKLLAICLSWSKLEFIESNNLYRSLMGINWSLISHINDLCSAIIPLHLMENCPGLSTQGK